MHIKILVNVWISCAALRPSLLVWSIRGKTGALTEISVYTACDPLRKLKPNSAFKNKRNKEKKKYRKVNAVENEWKYIQIGNTFLRQRSTNSRESFFSRS